MEDTWSVIAADATGAQTGFRDVFLGLMDRENTSLSILAFSRPLWTAGSLPNGQPRPKAYKCWPGERAGIIHP